MPTQKSFLRTMFSGKLGRTFLILYVLPTLLIILTEIIRFVAGCSGGYIGTPLNCSYELMNAFEGQLLAFLIIPMAWVIYSSPLGLILLSVMFVRGIRQYRINRNTSASSLQ